MINDDPQSISVLTQDKNAIKRKLARKLIQQIVSLYDTIIQKIEHGVGLLWEEYISQELYTIAKKRVQCELIQNINELEQWFENISQSIREKFNSLSDNLISHFDNIIQKEIQSLDDQVNPTLKFTTQEQLQEKSQQYQEDTEEKKENSSLYQTCTESSRQDQKSSSHPKKLCLACQNHLSEAFGLCSKHQLMHQKQGAFNYPSHITQQAAKDQIQQESQMDLRKKQQGFHSSDLKFKGQNSRRKRKQIQIQQRQQKDDYLQGSFYEVFFGLLEAFQM